MNPENMQQILAYLDKLGEKLGVGVNAIWPWFVKQVYIQCIGIWFLFILSVIGSVITAKGMVNAWYQGTGNHCNWNVEKDKWHVIRIVVLIIFLILFTVMGIGIILHGLDFLNPEYAAFEKLLSSLSKLAPTTK